MRYIGPAFALAVLPLLVPAHATAQGVRLAARTRVTGAAPVTPAPVSINGIAMTSAGQPVANATVRARNLLTGRVVGSTSTTGSGQFVLAGLDSGNYVLELVDAAGQVLGTSSFIYAAAGSTVAATVTATSGALSAVNTVTGFAAMLTTTAAESVKYAAVAAGVAGMVAPVGVATASPSR
jgi:carboxypeptidase family protein